VVNVNILVKLCDGEGNPLPNKLIHVFYSFDGVEWVKLHEGLTNEGGEVVTTHATDRDTWYKAVFEGDETYDYAEGIAFFNYTSLYVSTCIGFAFNWLIITPLMIASMIYILKALKKALKED